MTRYETDEKRWKALIVEAQAGNEDAYRILLRELASVTRAFLISRFGYFEMIEDVVQESLLALHRARQTFRPDHSFRAWYFAIVQNRCIDTIRSRQRLERHDALVSNQSAETALTELDAPIYTGQLLSRLQPTYREAFSLTRLEGLSIAESAQQIGISEASFRVRVSRAVRMVKRMLKEDMT